jgi:hypothetical protein
VLLGRYLMRKPDARLFVAAFALLSAVVATADSEAKQHAQEKATAQLSLREHDRAEGIRPQQSPVLRRAGRPSAGLRSKLPAKKKAFALASLSPSLLTASAGIAPRARSTRMKLLGFRLLRTQNPRAPPLS